MQSIILACIFCARLLAIQLFFFTIPELGIYELVLWKKAWSVQGELADIAKIEKQLIKELRESEKMNGIIPNSFDPFSGKEYRWSKNRSFIIYSIGIDAVDAEAIVKYDPTNGIYSYGDILYEIKNGNKP